MRFEDIRNWAEDRNLIEGSDPKSQMLKLTEELGELAHAIARDNKSEIVDALGDLIVVATILAAQYDWAVEECIEHAWHEIKDRKGRMVDGIFIKEA